MLASPEFAKLREAQGLFPFDMTGARLDAYVKGASSTTPNSPRVRDGRPVSPTDPAAVSCPAPMWRRHCRAAVSINEWRTT